ncbi:hypothetical protein HJG60_009162 [Phyllostomus discolor]|uniref:Uncharacterized protein n=1 Tax=Phyllostomus discolor TaxID=89673 RepID=A0A833YJW6_9CHIR|nr:hypothetical protein HJG60_009162 [Phyllostomus discolor]
MAGQRGPRKGGPRACVQESDTVQGKRGGQGAHAGQSDRARQEASHCSQDGEESPRSRNDQPPSMTPFGLCLHPLCRLPLSPHDQLLFIRPLKPPKQPEQPFLRALGLLLLHRWERAICPSRLHRATRRPCLQFFPAPFQSAGSNSVPGNFPTTSTSE